MILSLKLWLVRRWFPDVFEQARAYQLVSMNIGDLKWWCGREFPILNDASQWLMDSQAAYFADQGRPTPAMAMGISDFREYLRRKHGDLDFG